MTAVLRNRRSMFEIGRERGCQFIEKIIQENLAEALRNNIIRLLRLRARDGGTMAWMIRRRNWSVEFPPPKFFWLDLVGLGWTERSCKSVKRD